MNINPGNDTRISYAAFTVIAITSATAELELLIVSLDNLNLTDTVLNHTVIS